MEFSGRLFLTAIEEDNTQRALFRVRPLLAVEGSISQEEIDTLGDEGFLRVVPDRAEQHSFKERMRELGQLCLIDLRDVPAETSKVRNNKNYSPNFGEVNRYVIYSDAIRSLSEAEVFEVVAEGRAAQPDTPYYYLRKGGHIQGPFSAESARPAATLSFIAPDDSRLFSVSMPDGREKLYYWPGSPATKRGVELPTKQEDERETEVSAKEAEPVQEQKAPEKDEEPTAAPMSAKDRILKLQAAISPLLEAPAEEELPAEDLKKAFETPSQGKPGKLSGTPIRAGVRKPSAARRDSLSLSSVVDREMRRGGRPQEPSASLIGAHDLRPVENPAEQFKQALRRLWNAPETRDQALESFLAMDGAARVVGERLSDGHANMMQALAHQQLNELEAERLALVMEIENLRQNQSGMLKEALAQEGKEAKQLETRKAELAQAAEQIHAQCAQLDERRVKLIDELKAMASAGCYAAPGFGENCSFEKAAKLVAQTLGAAGFEVSVNEASSMLLMVLTYPQLALVGDNGDDARLAARLLSRAIGASLAECAPGEEPAVLPGGDAAVFALYERSPAGAAQGGALYTRLILTDSDALPRVRLKAAPGFGMEMALREGICARKETLIKAIDDARREVPSRALELLAQAEEALGGRMPLSIKRDILSYIGPAQTMLEGGISAALDHAFAGFIIPYAQHKGKDANALRSLCAQMPLSSALL